MAKRNKWISSARFHKLKKGEKVVIRYMIGDAYIAGPITVSDNPEEEDKVAVRFESGPWKGKTLNLIRQQISTGKESFPKRE